MKYIIIVTTGKPSPKMNPVGGLKTANESFRFMKAEELINETNTRGIWADRIFLPESVKSMRQAEQIFQNALSLTKDRSSIVYY